jgi:hypothetical protein
MARHRKRRHQQQEAGPLDDASRDRPSQAPAWRRDCVRHRIGGPLRRGADRVRRFHGVLAGEQAHGPGWNRRIFTDTDARKGDSIKCDFATGVVSLAPGAYHLTGMSMVSYPSGGEPETTTIRAPASAGYCRLRVFDPRLSWIRPT